MLHAVRHCNNTGSMAQFLDGLESVESNDLPVVIFKTAEIRDENRRLKEENLRLVERNRELQVSNDRFKKRDELQRDVVHKLGSQNRQLEIEAEGFWKSVRIALNYGARLRTENTAQNVGFNAPMPMRSEDDVWRIEFASADVGGLDPL